LEEKLAIIDLFLDELRDDLKSGKTGDLRRKAGDLRATIRNELSDSRSHKKGIKTNSKSLDEPLKLEIGELYYVPQLDKNARLLSAPDAKGRVQIASGNLKMQVEAAELSKALLEKNSKQSSHVSYRSATKGFSPELKLIGMRYEEAEIALSQFLDQASLTSIKELRIVHGKGNGILRKMVQSHLRKDRRVQSFKEAPFGQGDAGVTLCSLK
ncbi:MAG: Smr/MutS family protein, partial [Eubacteriales bacterium]|nr:Smr/MutS family protein [Eubacteriales bacterium]